VSAAPDVAAARTLGPLDRHHFLLRRLHSLTGVIPVGAFVCVHLFTNFQMVFASITGEAHYFQDEVNFIHGLPALLFIEIFGLWLPIAFHAILGVVYIFSGKNNSMSYRYGDNVRYTWQRITAWIALIFIFYHVATLRWGWTFGWDAPVFWATGLDEYPLAHATTAMALQHGILDGWLTTLFYLVGALAVVYHWSNGLWTAAITWGLTITPSSQKKWGYVCAGMGIVLAIFTIGAIWSARTFEVTPEHLQAIEAAVRQIEAGNPLH
jgi:succinate dehydrogenase / fumarate reductase cytochrome b subunit